jgi:predicted aconitase with swiveling domain
VRERLRRLAWLLDSSIRIPGTRWTVGIDALIGLVPVLGDAAGVILSSYILYEAARMGAAKGVLARMALNIAIEGLVGSIPLLGDLFDAGFKANQRNIRLLGL